MQRLSLFSSSRLLWVFAVAGVLLSLAAVALLEPAPAQTHLRDFDVFWLAGLLAGDGQVTQIYPPEALGRQLNLLFGTSGTASYGLPYPPSSLLFFLPLPYVSPAQALAIYLAAVAFLLMATGWRAAGNIGVLLTFGFAGVHLAADYGQLSPLLTALLGLTVVQMPRRPAYAGLLAGLAIIKPHLGWLLAVALPAGRHWLATLIAAVFTVLVVFASYRLLPDSWAAFFTLVQQVLHIPLTAPDYASRFISPYFWLQAAGAGKGVAMLVQGILMLFAAVVTCKVFSRCDKGPRLVALGLLVPLAFPYMYAYELCVNLLAILGWAHMASQRQLNRAEILAFSVLYFLPLFVLLGYGGVWLTAVQLGASATGLYGLRQAVCSALHRTHPAGV